MADVLKQGVEYEISAKDATAPGVESAKATVEEGAKAASKSAETRSRATSRRSGSSFSASPPG